MKEELVRERTDRDIGEAGSEEENEREREREREREGEGESKRIR